ncbi:PREDICTED: uncharacterized protein LOC104603393 [Nelumbo nucifera]|uniref:Uncharacterized protein n=2 Tax=Nelumbo nucifera TaxID=4432 RepID=A0A822Y8F6_NELNU|nr:PREDICTED: uncharacterized protein LOC104603393 [Nelumbo nucifera]DAD27315.1 TPA_asm: hypothetical protein HUJ06_028783 [Nelumbo nucifera]
MALRTRTRRLSLDLIQKAVSDISSEMGISKYMDLRVPSQSTIISNDVRRVECECCGLFEDCTRAYIRQVRARFCGRWVCGLCSEAVREESQRIGTARHIIWEEALHAHMQICQRFNKFIRVNPAMSLAGSMTQILKKSSKRREALSNEGSNKKSGSN